MKRSLEVLVEPDTNRIAPPRILQAGDTRVTVVDAGDGRASSRLASWLVDAGAAPVDIESQSDSNIDGIRIVIRASALTVEARKRTAMLESSADFVLGSARPAFARRLAEALLGDR